MKNERTALEWVVKNEKIKLDLLLAQAKEKGIPVIGLQKNTMSIEETFGMPKMEGTDEA